MPKENKNALSNTKRKLLKPTAWSAPVIAAASLPQHAQASPEPTTTIEMAMVCYDFTAAVDEEGDEDLSYGSAYGGWTVNGTDVASVEEGGVDNLEQMAAIMTMDDPNSNTWTVSGNMVCITIPASIASQYGAICSKDTAEAGCIPVAISALP